MSINQIEQKRRSVLRRAWDRAENPEDSFSRADLDELHRKIAYRAMEARRDDPRTKWILKLTCVFENMAPVTSYDDRLALALAVERTWKDNKFSFLAVNPDHHHLGLKRV